MQRHAAISFPEAVSFWSALKQSPFWRTRMRVCFLFWHFNLDKRLLAPWTVIGEIFFLAKRLGFPLIKWPAREISWEKIAGKAQATQCAHFTRCFLSKSKKIWVGNWGTRTVITNNKRRDKAQLMRDTSDNKKKLKRELNTLRCHSV